MLEDSPAAGNYPDLAAPPPQYESTTKTMPLIPLVTYAARSVGWTATQRGS